MLQAGSLCATCVLCLSERLPLFWGVPAHITHVQQDGDQPAGFLAERVDVRLGELTLPSRQRAQYAPKCEPLASVAMILEERQGVRHGISNIGQGSGIAAKSDKEGGGMHSGSVRLQPYTPCSAQHSAWAEIASVNQ